MNDHDIKKTAMIPSPIRIAVFDDHPMFREGVVQMLKRVEGFEIVGEGATGTDALEIAQEGAPDVILLDLCMPGGGIEAAACIAHDCPDVGIIMLTVSECEHDVASALQAGARGYVLKGSSESEVVDAVHAIARGNFYFTPNLAARLLIEKGKRIENSRQRPSPAISLFAGRNSLRLRPGEYLN
jgi:two-component system, NarL family, nitrate/nitrite response regulator NarL